MGVSAWASKIIKPGISIGKEKNTHQIEASTSRVLSGRVEKKSSKLSGIVGLEGRLPLKKENQEILIISNKITHFFIS